MKENKTQFFISDKPIDLADITPLEIECPEKTFSPEPKTITMSFACEMPKETADWFKKQMEELQEKENEILDAYRKIAKFNASYYLPVFDTLVEEEQKFKLLEDIILKAMCKGWNDCFDLNVKHKK